MEKARNIIDEMASDVHAAVPPTPWMAARQFKGKVSDEMYNALEQFEMEHGSSKFKRHENDEIKDVWLANDFKGWVWVFRYDQDAWEQHATEKKALDASYRDDSFL